jgi:hypothetical protein
VTADLLAAIASRITNRDREILHAVHEHRVLTTNQIVPWFFDGTRTATGRLGVLYRMRLLDRMRPYTDYGGAPYHWVLDEAGARVLATEQEISVTEFGYRRQDELSILLSSHLAHVIGVSNLAAALHVVWRADPAADVLWWTRRQCVSEWQGRIKPDAYVQWGSGGSQKVDFFLEYLGSASLAPITSRVDAYNDLARATGLYTRTLFVVGTQARADKLRATAGQAIVPTAVAVVPPTYDLPDITGPIWRPLTPASGAPRRLIEL